MKLKKVYHMGIPVDNWIAPRTSISALHPGRAQRILRSCERNPSFRNSLKLRKQCGTKALEVTLLPPRREDAK